MQRQTFDQHGLWTTVQSLGDLMRGDLSGDNDEHRDQIRLAHSVTRYAESLRDVDPYLVEDASLDSLNGNLGQALSALTSYLEDREANVAHLTTAESALNTARDLAIRMLPSPPSTGEVNAAEEARSRYQDAADAEIHGLRERIETLQTRLEETESQRQDNVRQADQSLAALEGRVDDVAQQVATQTTQLQEQIETQRSAFNEEATQRQQTYQESETKRDAAAEERREEHEASAEAVLDTLEKYRKQAQDLLDATNRDLVSGDYRGWATKQATAAFGWTVTTVIVGLLTVAALVAVILTAKNDSVQFLLSKSTVGVIGLIIAGYAARQAAEHRDEERTANRLALDLAALEPFLEHISAEEQVELRREIAKRVFVPEPVRSGDAPRVVLRKRSMSLAEILELAKVLRTPPT